MIAVITTIALTTNAITTASIKVVNGIVSSFLLVVVVVGEAVDPLAPSIPACVPDRLLVVLSV